jgi:hypothetical protein
VRTSGWHESCFVVAGVQVVQTMKRTPYRGEEESNEPNTPWSHAKLSKRVQNGYFVLTSSSVPAREATCLDYSSKRAAPLTPEKISFLAIKGMQWCTGFRHFVSGAWFRTLAAPSTSRTFVRRHPTALQLYRIGRSGGFGYTVV